MVENEVVEAVVEATAISDIDRENIADLKALIADNPKLAEAPDVKKALADYDAAMAKMKSVEKKPEVKVEEGAAEEEKIADKEVVAQTEEEKAAEEVVVAGDKLGLLKTTPPNKIEIKEVNDITAILDKQFGIKADNPAEGLAKLQKSFNTVREQAKNAAEYKETIDQLQVGLNSLPLPIIAAINAHSQNPNDAAGWQRAYNNNLSVVDLSKKFEDHSPKEIFTQYFPKVLEGLDEDQIKDFKDDPVLLRAYNTAQELFNQKKNELNVQRETNLEQEKARKADFDSSISSAAETFTTQYPNADRKVVKELQALIKEPNGIIQLLYDKKGNPKPTALNDLFMLRYGTEQLKATINKEVDKAEKRGESKARKEIISRTADKPRAEGGAAPSAEEEQIRKLFASVKEDDPYENMNREGKRSRKAG